MVWNLILEMPEPEGRHLRQHLAFVGNGRGKHDIEGRKPVGRDDQEMLTKIINIPDFAPGVEFHAGQIGLLNGHGF